MYTLEGIRVFIIVILVLFPALSTQYALVDLSRYKEGKLGLRWRTQGEVIAAKGQFECGNVTKGKPCTTTSSLHSYELNFAYVEHGQQKQELVKVRVCSHCAAKLNYRRQHKRSGRDDDDEGSARSSSKKRKHHGRNDNYKARDEGEEKAPRSEPSASASIDVPGDQRDADRSSSIKDTGDSNNACSEKAAEASAWSGEAPTAKSEGDEMDAYLRGLFL